MDEQLQRWRNAGYSAASVNKFRTALMSLGRAWMAAAPPTR